jgi:hypothetical protein
MPAKKPVKKPVKTPTKKPAKKPVIKYPDHSRCRPPRDAGDEVLQYNDRGRWVWDTGEPGLLFIARSPTDPDDAVLWLAECRCAMFRVCPAARGLAYADELGFSATSIVRRRATRRRRSS